MTIHSEAELTGLRRAGAVVRDVLRALESRVEPGMTTRELDALCARQLALQSLVTWHTAEAQAALRARARDRDPHIVDAAEQALAQNPGDWA